MELEVDYLLYVTAQDGELAVLPGQFNKLSNQIRLQRELLLLLGPYAASVGRGKWIGARVSVEHLTEDTCVDIAEITSLGSMQSPLGLLIQNKPLAVEFDDYRMICNFTRGEYLSFPDSYRSWLTFNHAPGKTLLDILTTKSNKSWSGCEIAVTHTDPPWMRKLELPPPGKATHGTARPEGS